MGYFGDVVGWVFSVGPGAYDSIILCDEFYFLLPVVSHGLEFVVDGVVLLEVVVEDVVDGGLVHSVGVVGFWCFLVVVVPF